MLTWTSDAAVVIRSLIDAAGLDDGAGLRFQTHPTARSLIMDLAAAPHRRDDVVNHHGERVFLDPCASTRLENQILDAQITDRGPKFFLTSRSR